MVNYGPSSRSTEAAWVDPILALHAAKGMPGLALLDSGGEITPPGRFSALAVRPLEVAELRVGAGLASGIAAIDPFERLGALYKGWRARALAGHATGEFPGPAEAAADFPCFTGGVLALLAYDAGRALERLPVAAQDDDRLPDLWAAVYDGAIVFDRAERRTGVVSWGFRGSETSAELVRILEDARRLERNSAPAPGQDGPAGFPSGAVDPDPSRRFPGSGAPRSSRSSRVVAGLGSLAREDPDGREQFIEGVHRIREEIASGEIYQANLTRRVVRPVAAGEAIRIYERLRARSPTPFGAFVDAGPFQVLSASPERFLLIAGGTIETRPIKGTRPRGGDEEEDARLRAELTASDKDRAELLMIVDLERNDLGRVSQPGSIEASARPTLETYSTVSHLVATVRGRLRGGCGPEAALRAAFPGGSITGAPKLRAMEILEALEPYRRKFSMGSLLAWGFNDLLDSSILIRTITIRRGEAIFNVGSGIVADSSPEDEYLETVAKAAPLLDALEGR